MFDFAKLKSSISNLGREQKKLNSEVEKMKQLRETLQALPRSREDLAAVIDAWLLDQRSVFLDRLKQNINFLIQSPDAKPNDDLSVFSARDVFGNSVSRDGALLGLLGPLIRESLRDAINELPGYPEETGESWPKREKEILALDKKIGDLESKIEDLQSSANEAGISLSPAVEPKQPDFSGGEPLEPEARQKAFERVNEK